MIIFDWGGFYYPVYCLGMTSRPSLLEPWGWVFWTVFFWGQTIVRPLEHDGKLGSRNWRAVHKWCQYWVSQWLCLFLNVDPVCVEMDLVQPNKQTCDQVYHKTLRWKTNWTFLFGFATRDRRYPRHRWTSSSISMDIRVSLFLVASAPIVCRLYMVIFHIFPPLLYGNTMKYQATVYVHDSWLCDTHRIHSVIDWRSSSVELVEPLWAVSRSCWNP